MKKQINYVKCESCSYQMEQEGYDPHKQLCKLCNNTRQVQDPKDILCNMCGGSMCFLEELHGSAANAQIPSGLHNQTVSGHYDSEYLNDTTNYKFNLCEQCLRKMFNAFVIKPEISYYMAAPPEDKWTFEEDQKSYEHKLWRQAGGEHQAYLAGNCNASHICTNKAIYTVYFYEEFTEHAVCDEHKDWWKNTYGSSLVPFIKHELKVFL